MSIQLKLRRGTTAQHSTFTGASGEVTVDTDKKTLVVHDGTTAGGNPVLPAVNPSYTGTLTGGTGVVNLGSGQFYKDTSGNVGIGTSSPNSSSRLHVVGGRTYLDAPDEYTIRLYKSGTAGAFIGTSAADTLNFYNATGTERMRIDSSGNVGIGTAIQNERLRLNSSSAAQARMSISYTDSTIAFFGSYSGIVGSGNATDVFLSSTNVLAFGAGGTTERARIASNGQMSTTDGAGNVRAAYDCRAWVNFNGTGTVAIRASGNVSSITDNGVGDYTLNFATAMSDANFSAVGSAFCETANNATLQIGRYTASSYNPHTTSSIRISIAPNFSTGSFLDSQYVDVAVFR